MSETARPHTLRSVARPKQARSAETLERLLDAAQAIIKERGGAELSIPEVVARAGSSVGGFYARFKDKDELVCALEERFVVDMRRLLDVVTDADRLRGLTLRQFVGPAIGRLVRLYRRNERLAAAFAAASAHNPGKHARTRAFRDEIVERGGALVLTRSAEIGHPDPERAVEFAIQMVLSTMRAEAVFGPTRARGRALSENEMVVELEHMFVRYLGIT